jgi:TPR repeat protein
VAKAQAKLGLCYVLGVCASLPQDDGEGFKWLTLAAGADDNMGLFGLARCYQTGAGCDVVRSP